MRDVHGTRGMNKNSIINPKELIIGVLFMTGGSD